MASRLQCRGWWPLFLGCNDILSTITPGLYERTFHLSTLFLTLIHVEVDVKHAMNDRNKVG
jgi:hypothetical protein